MNAPNTTPNSSEVDYDLVDIDKALHDAVRFYCGATAEKRDDDNIFYQAAKRIKSAANGAFVLNLLVPIAVDGDPACDRITFRRILGKDYVSGAADANQWALGDALGGGRVSLIECEDDLAGVALCVQAIRGNFGSRRR